MLEYLRDEKKWSLSILELSIWKGTKCGLLFGPLRGSLKERASEYGKLDLVKNPEDISKLFFILLLLPIFLSACSCLLPFLLVCFFACLHPFHGHLTFIRIV